MHSMVIMRTQLHILQRAVGAEHSRLRAVRPEFHLSF